MRLASVLVFSLSILLLAGCGGPSTSEVVGRLNKELSEGIAVSSTGNTALVSAVGDAGVMGEYRVKFNVVKVSISKSTLKAEMAGMKFYIMEGTVTGEGTKTASSFLNLNGPPQSMPVSVKDVPFHVEVQVDASGNIDRVGALSKP